jgi:hypothetical protein
MGCLPKAPKIVPPAPEPAPAAQGADALSVGPAEDPLAPHRPGNVGRLALRVGRPTGPA